MEFELEYKDNTLNVVAEVAVYRDEGTYDTPPYTEHEVLDLEVSMYDHEDNLVYLPTELLDKELRDEIDNAINDRVE
jgi:hypothetical protein